MCGAPAVLNMILDAAAEWDGPIPGRGPGADRRRRRAAADRTIERTETELGLGVRPDLRAHRDGAAAHDQPRCGRVGRPLPRRAGGASSIGPVPRSIGCTMAVDADGRDPGPRQHGHGRATGSSPTRPSWRSTTASSTPATAGTIDDDELRHDRRPQEGRHHLRWRERRARSRSRTRSSSTPT